MNYQGHLYGGIATSAIVAGTSLFYGHTDYSVSIVCAATTLVFSLYPDLDTSSTPSKYAFILGIPLIVWFIFKTHYIPAFLSLMFISIPKMFPHRGLVHTLRFGLFASIVWFFILQVLPVNIEYIYIGVSSLIGYMTHLILDSHVRI